MRELPLDEQPRHWVEEAEVALDAESPVEPAESPVEPAESQGEEPFPRGAQRYKVEFTATDEYVELLNQARDLLAHAKQLRGLEESHLRAMRLLVADLKKRKYGMTKRPPDEPTDPRQRGRHIPARVRRSRAPPRRGLRARRRANGGQHLASLQGAQRPGRGAGFRARLHAEEEGVSRVGTRAGAGVVTGPDG